MPWKRSSTAFRMPCARASPPRTCRRRSCSTGSPAPGPSPTSSSTTRTRACGRTTTSSPTPSCRSREPAMRSKKYLAGWAVALLPVLAAAQDLSDLIRSGDVQGAIAAIGAGADVNARQSDGTTPLLWAVYAVDRDLVRELLARGADPNVRNSLGATALTEAVNLADAELVRLLLKAKADPNLGNDYNQTPLMLAASTGSLPIVEMLVKAGAHVNDSEKMRDQTPLMWAIGNGNAAVVDFLIRHKAEVDVRAAINDWGNQITSEPRAQYRPSGGLTPLLYATRSGCLDCVKPLMNAIDNLRYDVANYLLDRGANPHLTDWWGRSALYIAIDMRTFSPRFAG